MLDLQTNYSFFKQTNYSFLTRNLVICQPCVCTEASVVGWGEGRGREGREIGVGGEKESEGGVVGLEGVGRWWWWGGG